MRFVFTPSRIRINRRAQWHRWFAWRPVSVAEGQVRWLEFVERKGFYDHRKNSTRRPPWRWQYRSA